MARLLVALAGIAGAALVVAFLLDDGDDHPSEWDERVVDLVAFVEDERGHEFEHPVPVDFLDEEAYAELRRADPTSLSDEELEEIEQVEGMLRAVGLVAGDVDLIEATNDLSDTGTLAYYDLNEQRVVVRGTEVTPDLAVTLVHELTHVLQDQIFDLRVLTDESDDLTSGERFAMRALVEGDAGRIEEAYRATLSPDELAAVDDALDEGLDDLDAEEVPIALQALFGAPYALGDGFVAVLDAAGDVDDAFEDRPTTEEHLLDPFRFLDREEAAAVAVPDVGDAEVFDEGDFGVTSLLLVLAERIELRDALAATLGWGGDAYVAYESDGRTCMRLDVTGDTEGDTAELASAFEAWVAAAPAESASTSRDGDLVSFESCDPGDDAAVAGSGSSIEALQLASVRVFLAVDALGGGASEAQAECFGDAIVRELTFEQISGGALSPEEQQRVQELALGCR